MEGRRGGRRLTGNTIIVTIILANFDGALLQARDGVKHFVWISCHFRWAAPHTGWRWEVGREDQHPVADGSLYLSIVEQ